MIRKITRRNLEKFLERHATDERVLDVGSGGSSYHRFFPNRLTLDKDPDRQPEIVADAGQLPFNDGEFKVILCTEVLEHVEDPFKVERELRRVIARGGKLILTTRFVYPLHDTPNDYWRFTKYGLQKIFTEWEILELSSETESFSTVAALLQRLSFQSVLKANKITKAVLVLLVVIFDRLNWLISREYGDIRRIRGENQIMPTGYYMVARKL